MDEYKAFLRDLGVSLPERRLDRLASRVARELELRVGNTITDELTDEQLEEFEDILAEAQERQAQWLLKHYPEYSEVVAEEDEKLRHELTKAKYPAVLIKHWHQAKS
jgi:hypothetical protein